jgi:hypothetical protein
MDFSASVATKDAARIWRRRSCTPPRFSSTLPQPEHDAERPAVGVHRDNDEERSARVEAMLETLQATNNATGNAVVRSKMRTSRRRVGRKRVTAR